MREPTLSYVALAARDTDAVHRFLSESLQLQCSYRQLGDRSVAFYAVGRAAVAVFSVDGPLSRGAALCWRASHGVGGV